MVNDYQTFIENKLSSSLNFVFYDYVIEDGKDIITLIPVLKACNKLGVDKKIDLKNFYIHRSPSKLMNTNPLFFHYNYKCDETDEPQSQILLGSGADGDKLVIHTLAITSVLAFSKWLEQENIKFNLIKKYSIDELDNQEDI